MESEERRKVTEIWRGGKSSLRSGRRREIKEGDNGDSPRGLREKRRVFLEGLRKR